MTLYYTEICCPPPVVTRIQYCCRGSTKVGGIIIPTGITITITHPYAIAINIIVRHDRHRIVGRVPIPGNIYAIIVTRDNAVMHLTPTACVKLHTISRITNIRIVN